MNALRKRKGVVGSSALSLINSWKQLVKEDNKPKPQIVVERCPSPPDDDNDDSDDIDGDDREVTEATSYSRLEIQSSLHGFVTIFSNRRCYFCNSNAIEISQMPIDKITKVY